MHIQSIECQAFMDYLVLSLKNFFKKGFSQQVMSFVTIPPKAIQIFHHLYNQCIVIGKYAD